MSPDYRSDRSQSPEGPGHAKSAWDEFHLVTAKDLSEEAGALDHREGAPDEARNELVAVVIEESELPGFWLAWWRAGGFAGLEAAGWNRATVFRKLRRFRTTFGVHPDDYRPDWLHLDLPAVWGAALRRKVEAEAAR